MNGRCFHEQFMVEAHTEKVRDSPDVAPHHYWVTLKMCCAICGEPFAFDGLPENQDIDRAGVDRTGTVAHFPVHPSTRFGRLIVPVGQRGQVKA